MLTAWAVAERICCSCSVGLSARRAGSSERQKKSSAAYAIARNADAGPWVTGKGPKVAGNSTTSPIPKMAISARFRLNNDMVTQSKNEVLLR